MRVFNSSKPSTTSRSIQLEHLPYINEVEGGSPAGKLPPELIFNVVEEVLSNYVHDYMVNNEEPPWDALSVLLKVSSVWRTIAGKIISPILGINLDEAGNLQSSPWYPLRTMHNWGILSRTSTTDITVVLDYDTLYAEHDFPQKSLFLSMYLLCFCVPARLRSITTLEDLASCWSVAGLQNMENIGHWMSSDPNSRLLNIAFVYFGREVFFALPCQVVARWLLSLTDWLDTLESTRHEGPLTYTRIEEIIGDSQTDHWNRVASIEEMQLAWQSPFAVNAFADDITPFSRDHIKEILEPKMEDIEPRLNDVTDEEDQAFRIREIWSQVCQLSGRSRARKSAFSDTSRPDADPDYL